MSSSKKILICDDEEGVRESLKLVLSDQYDLILADGGQECLQILKNSKDIGLVLLDIKMPVVGGFDVLDQIKKDYPQLPVIMISGYRSVEAAGETTRLGGNDYIVKPFKSTEILKTVARNLK